MNCETVRLTVKRVLGLLVMLPCTLAIMPILLVVVPIILLFETDSCDEFIFDLKDINEQYFGYIKELVVGK